MEEQVAWRGDRVARSDTNLPKGMKGSAGRGGPKSRSHASEPNPITQERFPSKSRNPTARNSAARSPQNDRRVARVSLAGFSITTRKIAARVSGAATGCEPARKPATALGALFGSDSIACHPGRVRGISRFEISPSPRLRKIGRKAYHRLPTNVHAASARGVCLEWINPQPSGLVSRSRNGVIGSERRVSGRVVGEPDFWQLLARALMQING